MKIATQNFDYLVGKVGRIYVAREGTVSVYALDNGETWLHPNGSISNAIFSEPAPNYWQDSAQEGAKYQYLTMQMTRDETDKPHYVSAQNAMTSPRPRIRG